MNYAALSAAIQAYTENTEADFVANIPVFVTQAEQRIYNTVQFPSIRKNVYGQVTANNNYLQCPTDFLAVYSLAIITGVTGGDLNTGTYEYLLNKDVNFIRQAYPTANDTGLPRFYALFGPRSDNADELTFILGPTPDSGYYTELHYYFYPESITVAADGRTWLGDNFERLDEEGNCGGGAPFTRADSGICPPHSNNIQSAPFMKFSRIRDPKGTTMYAPGSP